jgi:hypothetical protein
MTLISKSFGCATFGKGGSGACPTTHFPSLDGPSSVAGYCGGWRGDKGEGDYRKEQSAECKASEIENTRASYCYALCTLLIITPTLTPRLVGGNFGVVGQSLWGDFFRAMA